jgi:hypothetical protein
VLGFGIWMVVDSSAWDFGQGWVITALGLFPAAFLIGVAFQARAAIAAQRAAEEGEHREALRQLRRWSWGMRTIVALLVVAAWDMVAKPGSEPGLETQWSLPGNVDSRHGAPAARTVASASSGSGVRFSRRARTLAEERRSRR